MKRTAIRYWPWIFALLAALGIAALIVIRHTISHAEPILRAKAIQALSERFQSRVELAEFHVAVSEDVQVSGKGLQIFGSEGSNPNPPAQPLIAIDEFHFALPVTGLLRSPFHVGTVLVKGMKLNLPPKQQRRELENASGPRKEKLRFIIDRFVCQDTELIVNTIKPGKLPLIFKIRQLNMWEVGPGQPIRFEAMLVNPKPVGDIHSTGHFGPFHEQDPRSTPVDGEYSFSHAELQTFKGISGTLSSTGEYQGVLEKIEVQGSTETPNFRVIAGGGHPVNLHTNFQATVDGTDGDTYLHPVKAHFLNSSFVATGKVVKMPTGGHDIEINVTTEKARLEDFLTLGVNRVPPLMSGDIEMRAKMALPPGPADFSQRLALDGQFKVTGGLFSNDKIQGRIDSISLRSQGKPGEAKSHAETGIRSDLAGVFQLKQGVFSFSSLHFSVPGTAAEVSGTYSLDDKQFDFDGTLHFNAKLSQMTTGWKSLLLRAVDPFARDKTGKGTQIPFKITGSRSEPRFGLDLGRGKSKPGKSR